MHRPAREPSTAAEGTVAAGPAELTRHLTEDHDRIAREMNDIVIHRIFAAGLDLHAALGLIGDQRGASEICHAIEELDQAIRDIRDTIFDRRPRSFAQQGGPRKPCDSAARFHSYSVKTAMQISAG